MLDKKTKNYIISALRRINKWDKRRHQVLRNNKLERNCYLCSKCKELFGHKDVALDHIEPVVPITGFTTWDSFIERLFCDESGYQVLCKVCHKVKTQSENSDRRAVLKGLKDPAPQS